MGLNSAHEAVRAVVVDYVEGMVWGDEARLRRAFHPAVVQVGHFDGTHEVFSLEEFLDWLRAEPTDPVGTPYMADLISIEVTGTVAVAKISDRCFGTEFTDYLVLVNDRSDATGRWQIVTKAYHAHAGRGRGEAPL